MTASVNIDRSIVPVIVTVSQGSHGGNCKRHIYFERGTREFTQKWQLYSHDGSVEVTNLEDMQVMLGLDIILHGDIPARDSHHAGNILHTLATVIKDEGNNIVWSVDRVLSNKE